VFRPSAPPSTDRSVTLPKRNGNGVASGSIDDAVDDESGDQLDDGFGDGGTVSTPDEPDGIVGSAELSLPQAATLTTSAVATNRAQLGGRMMIRRNSTGPGSVIDTSSSDGGAQRLRTDPNLFASRSDAAELTDTAQR
jgi:hypothetical protein